ncbi:MAG: DNA-processing protein DprA, partial [Chloroflexi bacterium]|nr:DNA-processing protein DprA [Chloroflexota bacterium]
FLTLNRLRIEGRRRAAVLLSEGKSAREIVACMESEDLLKELPVTENAVPFDAEREIELCAQKKIGFLLYSDPDYPALLREIHGAPPVLYVRGELLPRDEWALAVVGTRRVTAYGREVTSRLAGELARCGVTVVSGLARGVDTVAHRAALDAGGRTIAVLGSGLDVVYPAENRKLAQQIAEQGALVSDYSLGTRPEAGNFPARNRIISGLALGTLVTEAGAGSGALITADYALDQGREVFAVPGSILSRGSAGTNDRIQQGGAKLVASVPDILEELNLTMIADHQEAREVLPANETEAALLAQLAAEPVHIDQLARGAALPVAEVSAALTMMELKGLVRHAGGMQYARVRETPAEYHTTIW